MRVLSFTQPWATLVCRGEKEFETRSWKSWYYGTILIHASKAYPGWAKQLEKEEPFYSSLRPHGQYSYPELACGHIIGSAEVVECIPTEAALNLISEKERAFGDYGPGRYAWRLRDPRFLPKPIPAKGHLGLWEFDFGNSTNEQTDVRQVPIPSGHAQRDEA